MSFKSNGKRQNQKLLIFRYLDNHDNHDNFSSRLRREENDNPTTVFTLLIPIISLTFAYIGILSDSLLLQWDFSIFLHRI
jgi:hypothetical protein